MNSSLLVYLESHDVPIGSVQTVNSAQHSLQLPSPAASTDMLFFALSVLTLGKTLYTLYIICLHISVKYICRCRHVDMFGCGTVVDGFSLYFEGLKKRAQLYGRNK